MKIMSWHLSSLIPSSPPLYLLGFSGLIWKVYAYIIAMGLLTLITGGIGFLYLFEVAHRLNLSYRQRPRVIEAMPSSINKIRA